MRVCDRTNVCLCVTAMGNRATVNIIIKLMSNSVFSELFRLKPAVRDTPGPDAVAGVDRLETPSHSSSVIAVH
jgi:hypothetical protein